MASGLLPYTFNDWFSWKIYDWLPKTSNNTDIFFFGSNPFKRKMWTAWHIKPRSVFPHTRRFRLLTAICEKDINEIKLVLDSGYDINTEIIDDKYGHKALTLVAALNRIGLIEYMYLRGANLNVQDKFGNTPLMVAVINWQYDMIKWLVEHGADVEMKDIYGFNAIEKAEMRGLLSVAKYLRLSLNKKREVKMPKFSIEFDFESKLDDNCKKLYNEYKYYDPKPKVYPFNNIVGTYIVSLVNYDQINNTPLLANDKSPK